MPDLQKYFFPLGVTAAIVGIWVALRKPNVGPTQSNQISPAASGLPNYTPQAISYQVNPPQLAAPTQAQLLSDPYNPNPALANPSYGAPPAYLAFNFGPGHDLSKIPLSDSQIAQLHGNRPTQQSTSSCGCGGGENFGGCANDPNHSVFPDGRGGYMAQNGKTLVQKLNRQDPSWLPRATYNIAGSDITPETLPFQGQMTQPNSAATTQTLTPSTPGAGIVNDVNVSSNVDPNINPIQNPMGSLSQFGNQVLQLSAAQISRSTGVRWQ